MPRPGCVTIRVGRTCNHLVVRMWQPGRTGSLKVPILCCVWYLKRYEEKENAVVVRFISHLWDLFFTSGSSCASRVAGSVVYHLFLFLFSLLDNEHWGVVSLLLLGWWKKGDDDMAGAVNNAKKKSPAMKLNDINIKERPEKDGKPFWSREGLSRVSFF